jgi:hypothetical protein
VLDDAFRATLTRVFADAVMKRAALPAARRADVEGAPRWSTTDGEIICTCGITGCEYTEAWDGSQGAAEAFAQSAGESTADLVARTPKNHHYAWLYAAR